MYILKNSLISIFRNKGRNILIGLIILTIACASTVTLAIRNTADTIVKSYEESHDLIATISFDRGQLGKNFKGGEDAQKENIEAFNNIQAITIDDVKNYGDSSYLKGYYYTYTTSLNSDTLSKATDSFEYEVEDKQTSTSSNTTTTGGSENRPDMPDGQMGERHTVTENNTTTVITKSKEKFESDKNLTGDFELDGYSSYDAMTEFTEGTSTITDGEMISDFNGFECAISSELATLNSISVGDTITLKKFAKSTYLNGILLLILIILIVNSSTLSLLTTVKILALPVLISLSFATVYSFLLGISPVYVPNIPLLVFSNTLPNILELSYLAFFSPGLPILLRVTPVTVELYILPSFISSFCPVFFSIISCPNAPNNLVLGSM